MKSSFEPTMLPGRESSAFVPRSGDEPFRPEPEPQAESESAAVEAAAEASAQREWAAAAERAQAEAIEALHSAVVSLDGAREEARRVAGEEQRRWLAGALDLGFALARRVLERELSLDPDAFQPLIERAAGLLRPGVPLEIALPPEALVLAESHASESLEAIRQKHDVTFLGDASLGRDEARVSAGASRVDVGIEAMLALLRDELSPDWNSVTATETEPV